MSNQYKRKIKVVTIKQSFYNLFDEDSEIMQTKSNLHRSKSILE